MDLEVMTSPSSYSQSADLDGCPSLAVIFGSWQAYSVLLCSHRIRSVLMTVFYDGEPSANIIDPQNPPVLDATQSSKYLLDTVSSQPNFFYKVQQHLVRDNLKTIDPKPLWDPFFDHLIYGPYNVTADSIVGEENTEALITAVNKIYNKYMVQVINLNFRVPMENTSEAGLAIEGNQDEITTVNGTRTQQVARLKVNFASKLALQIMLSAMLLLAGAALLLVKVRCTLPRSPHSIASVMGFLAGSRMCDSNAGIIPPGSEYLNDKELKSVIQNQAFSLGWWASSKASVTEAAVNSEEEVVGEVLIAREVVVESLEIERFGIDVDEPLAACELDRQTINPFRPKTVEMARSSTESSR